jgi:hypothetical protein
MLWADMASAETIDGFTYTLNASTSTATVTGTPSGNVVIPATVYYNNRTYKVTAITGVHAQITSCEIPEGVTSFGKVFYVKSYLTSVSIPSTVQRIESEAFYQCRQLISVNISEGLTYIGNAAFMYCEKLSSINIPEGVTYIGDHAFAYCNVLQNITIPTTITSMGNASFYNSSNLKKIFWNAKRCVDFTSGENAPFNTLYTSSEKYYANKYTTSITFGEEVECIPAFLCYNFLDISTLVIPNSVKEIGKSAFYSYYQDYKTYDRTDGVLASVSFGTELEEIGDYAFYGRRNLKTVTIPDKCTTIGSYAFALCPLSTMNLGKGVTTIGNYAFAGNPYINTINCYAIAPPLISSNPFISINGKGATIFTGTSDLMSITLNVRSQAVDAYKAADVWKDMYVQAMENDMRTFTLNVSSADESMGATTPGGMYDEDSEILIYAAAKEGYQFSRWNDGNTDNPRIVKMIGDLSYKAYFEAVIPVYTYNITATANAVEGIVIGSGVYEAGTQATLAAVGNTGYHFVKWTDGNAANPRQVTVTADASFTAQFAKDAAKYTLTTSSTNSSQGTTYGQGIYEEGTNVAIFAVANDGYHFAQWNDGNTENPRMVTVSCDATYFANFAQDPVSPTLYDVTIKPENVAQGWTTEGGSFELGTQIMIYAHPANGFEFSQWSDGNTDNPRFLTIFNDVDLIAKFKALSPNGIRSTNATTGTPIRKIVRDGKVFIEYGDKTYTSQGIEIK